MSRPKFDRLMLDVEIGGNLKLIGLTDSEFRAHVAGVLSIAAKSPIRGRLLIGDQPAGAEHVAAQARVKPAVARSALAKLRSVGIVIPDLEFDCEQVHDFEAMNPAPKTDRTAAERQQRRRDRIRAERDGHADVTAASRRDVTPITPTKRREVEEECVSRAQTPRAGTDTHTPDLRSVS